MVVASVYLFDIRNKYITKWCNMGHADDHFILGLQDIQTTV